MMSEHTPGPWIVRLKNRKYPTHIYHECWEIKGPKKNHDAIATIKYEGFGNSPSKAVREANAKLIAAAPELLEAAEEMMAQMGGGNDFTTWETAKARMARAIARAKGEL